MFTAGKGPKLRSVPPLTAAQLHEHADWVAALEALIGEERARLCGLPTIPYWWSKWAPEQFVRERLEAFEAARQPMVPT
jgi:hypothetical protein